MITIALQTTGFLSYSTINAFIILNIIFYIFISGQNESKFVVQVRTTRVGSVNATGFTAIALKEGDTEVIQVNLNPGGNI